MDSLRNATLKSWTTFAHSANAWERFCDEPIGRLLVPTLCLHNGRRLVSTQLPCQTWQEDLKRLAVNGKLLEELAMTHQDIPFACRAHWNPGCLDWCEHGDTLESFSSRVKQVAARFGPPDSVEGRHWIGSYDDGPPDLVAKWKVGDFEVLVRTLRPKGCRIDPRTAYKEAEETAVHPECAGVLKELEDVGGDAS